MVRTKGKQAKASIMSPLSPEIFADVSTVISYTFRFPMAYTMYFNIQKPLSEKKKFLKMLQDSVHDDHEKYEQESASILQGAKKIATKLKKEYNTKADNALYTIHGNIESMQEENGWDPEEADHLYNDIHDLFYPPEEAHEDVHEEDHEQEDHETSEEESEEEEEEEEPQPPPKKRSKKAMTTRPRGRAPKGKQWNEATHHWDSSSSSTNKKPSSNVALAVRRIAPPGKKWNKSQNKWVSTNTYLRRLEN